ncbi:unnamed protein product [Adineta ricciae]|uniref:Uncharacterized protein n=1 Tax=Adineta ricciae TaxID=249248 RepID=A0A815Q9J0_ADIRI|nr:unnamed protein product [Adineta ricciae]CAF1504855.1 unnamed protein product [Adineta ricciae]
MLKTALIVLLCSSMFSCASIRTRRFLFSNIVNGLLGQGIAEAAYVNCADRTNNIYQCFCLCCPTVAATQEKGTECHVRCVDKFGPNDACRNYG